MGAQYIERTRVVKTVRGGFSRSCSSTQPQGQAFPDPCDQSQLTTTSTRKWNTTLPASESPSHSVFCAALSSVSDEPDDLLNQSALRIRLRRAPHSSLIPQVPDQLALVRRKLTIEDPAGSPRARAVGSYLGLRPRQDESGAQKPQLHITKAGDKFLRHLLVECAHYMLSSRGADSDLKRWGLKLAERGGKAAKKRAVVAVARKLSVLLLRLWMTGEIYEPLRLATLRGDSVATSS